ncbi:uncharacterized protein LOC130966031 [Arachis stenosperma]|uniref:uncharacterized protein LOC130966031 n=1 Tax=Arachis stenosperma TaxID=217475 RepID=UPI0025ABD18D|nr:uncharacterized protein LOC130966031 [Arachis stenosperma]
MPEASGNTPNPVDFMAALGNMAATMQATAEALGNQINNGNNGNNGDNGPMSLSSFLKVHPPTFRGTSILLMLITGYRLLSRHYMLSRFLMNSELCLEPTSCMVKLSIGGRGQMTITEYTSKFEELCRFSHICQGTREDFAEWKCIKYEGGLWSDIQSFVAPMEIRVFSELVNKSRVAKDFVRRAAAEKGSMRMPFQRTIGRNFALRGRQFKHGGFVPQNNQGQGNFKRPNTNANQGRRQGKQPQKDMSCHRYGKYHSGPCRFEIGVCYSCGQPGHLANSCPEKKRYETG